MELLSSFPRREGKTNRGRFVGARESHGFQDGELRGGMPRFANANTSETSLSMAIRRIKGIDAPHVGIKSFHSAYER